MKTKHIFKILTIVMMLVLTIFITGCESQQEKYTKASNELANYDRQTLQNVMNIINEHEKTLNTSKNDTERRQLLLNQMNEFEKLINEYEKNIDEKMENLQKIAKGNSELETDVRQKFKLYNEKKMKAAIMKAEFKNIEKMLKEKP